MCHISNQYDKYLDQDFGCESCELYKDDWCPDCEVCESCCKCEDPEEQEEYILFKGKKHPIADMDKIREIIRKQHQAQKVDGEWQL
jgi:hypothetical protein